VLSVAGHGQASLRVLGADARQQLLRLRGPTVRDVPEQAVAAPVLPLGAPLAVVEWEVEAHDVVQRGEPAGRRALGFGSTRTVSWAVTPGAPVEVPPPRYYLRAAAKATWPPGGLVSLRRRRAVLAA
jgi:hypothetical protein